MDEVVEQHQEEDLHVSPFCNSWEEDDEKAGEGAKEEKQDVVYATNGMG